MAWRDRLRRRAAAPDTAGPGSPGATGTPGPSASGDPGSAVPGDWDGGWRRTAAPELTVSRAPLGVSDGLAFRAGLAAWQNPSFDAGLGHALLPTAPAGLVSGVTRPAAAPQHTHSAGGPLLLRALRPEGADGPGESEGTADAPTTQVSRRTRPGARPSGPAPLARSSGPAPQGERSGDNSTAGKDRSGDAGRARGLTSAHSPAVLSSSPSAARQAAQPGAGPVVTPAAPATPLVRRVAVVPPAAADGSMARPAARTRPAPAEPSRPPAGSGGRTPGRTPPGPAVQRTAAGPQPAGGARQPEAPRAAGSDMSHPAVRLRPVGPALTVARRPAGPARRVPALRPAAAPAPGRATTPDPPGPASAPVRRAATREAGRGPLGAPLSELPSTAAPLPQSTPAPGAGSATGPALPVVQRQAEGGAGTPGPYDGGTRGTAPAVPRRTPGPGNRGARARGGLGAPLSALPPSAEVPGTAASGARASRPDIQRATTHQDPGSGAAPAPPTPDRDRTPTEAAPRTPGAPLLGTGDVQRRLANPSATGGTMPSGPADHGNGPATPLVTPSAAAPARGPVGAEGPEGPAGNAPRPGTTSGGQRPQGPSVPGPVVVARAVADGTGGNRTPGGPGADGQRPRDAAVQGRAAQGPAVLARAAAEGTGAGSGSGRHRSQGPAAPSPVVVARAVARGTGGARPSGSADPLGFPVTRSTAHSALSAPRTLSLLAERRLTLNTRAPEGVAQPAVSRSGGRPVVAARWPGAPAGPRSDSTPAAEPSGRRSGTSAPSPGGPGTRARPAPGPSALAPATPQVQRAAAPYSGPEGSGVPTTGSPAPVQRVPVVRPAPPRQGTAAPVAAVPARPLPVTAPQAPPLADRPPVGSAPGGAVPVVRPRTVTAAGAAGGTGGTGGAALAVQRDARGRTRSSSAPPAPSTGAPAKEVPAPGRKRSSSVSSAVPAATATSAASGEKAARRTETPQDDPGLDLDDLARRLLDPVARLLRTELRRGRDRTGRPYDGRR
ncbi:hypothetical protein [Streptomyces sp. NBC_00328]|uniref:hypothetical protein n=1 Tax=Streptomyces sp. NBC_00328 TaxID=2903646 RepID=UPI002E2B34E7|nr:hypothetical protein [Streptomyces sp. NBC_00328]